MEVNIYGPSDDAGQIIGFTVVVDVFRAFSMSYYIDERKPEQYIIAESIEHAMALRQVYKNAVLIGERQGIMIDGFDLGNSPTEIKDLDLRGKKVVHTTTSGTKGLLAQPEQNEVVTGSFVNLGALLTYITQKKIERVNIYCTAEEQLEYGREDYIFADYMKNRLLELPCDYEKTMSQLRALSAPYLSDRGFAPYSDFLYCMDINRFNAILKRKYSNKNTHKLELERIYLT
ncbi:2-phosphosulfolactate phosphatase [Robertkochia solimangrovi]|uniref:2-phosphosulfolactate phosphatase n=1 Tax=Robertkochia solimangrovi TaxID=2213046 RepID=UPI00117D7571|nr:2-phosphosulfolactate phosphatase [Robertkochia solimangrovi]TRZ46214.1 hypothetical protein DMZ48_02865 [Robertkochia solimangrovi]